MEESNEIKLNLASGMEYMDGWVNIDDCSMFPDIRVDQMADIKTLEKDNESIDIIRLSHFAMYLRPEEMKVLLKRWYGWLKPRGRLVIETIDIKKVAKIVATEQSQSIINDWGLTNLFGTSETGPHTWGWSEQSLTALLYQSGFEHIQASKGFKKPKRDINIVATK